MDKVPYTYPIDAKGTKTVAGLLFHPGDTRPIPRSLHPDPKVSGAKRGAAPTAEPAEDDLETLRSDSVKSITGKLPQLDDDQLVELLGLENKDEKPRKGVVTAIEEEQLRREAADEGKADETQSGDGEDKSPEET